LIISSGIPDCAGNAGAGTGIGVGAGASAVLDGMAQAINTTTNIIKTVTINNLFIFTSYRLYSFNKTMV
jgi:hypothetical protein